MRVAEQSGVEGGAVGVQPLEDPRDCAEAAARGEPRALARALTWIENRDPRADQLLAALPPAAGAFRLGVTGSPGVGKSSLVARLVELLREAGEKIGVLAVDPTSPITGGALLGDRVRMEGSEPDPGLFVRSVASRDGAGGLAAAPH